MGEHPRIARWDSGEVIGRVVGETRNHVRLGGTNPRGMIVERWKSATGMEFMEEAMRNPPHDSRGQRHSWQISGEHQEVE